MAPRSGERAPAAPARTSMTRGASPSASASRITCSITRAGFAQAGHRGFRRILSPRRDAGPVHPLQPADQVSRPARNRARARRLGARHRPLCAPDGGAGRTRAAPGARCGARPELFPVRDDPCRARFPALSAGRPRQGRDPRAGAPLRPAGRRQAGQPGHLLCPAGLLCAAGRAAAAGGGRTRRHCR